MSKQVKLKYKIVSCSSEDQLHPASNLIFNNHAGWQSARFCNYPQEITLQFYSVAHIKKLEFLSNNIKISSRVDILYYLNTVNDDVETRFTKYGFLQLSNNEHTNYEGKQFKTILVDIKCVYLRFLFHRNHANKHNFFSQIGIHEINAVGEGVQLSVPRQASPRLQKSRRSVKNIEKDRMVDQFIYEKLIRMEELKEQAVDEQNYEEAKRLKQIIKEIKNLGYQISGLQDKKLEAVQNEDYEKAQKIKLEIDRIRVTADQFINNYQTANNKTHKELSVENQSEANSYSRVLKTHENQFVEEAADDEQTEDKRMVESYDEKVVPALLKKSEPNNEFQKEPPPKEVEPINEKYEKDAVLYLSVFDELTVRKFFSQYWQFKLQALEIFSEEAKSGLKTKNMDYTSLVKLYLEAVSTSITIKVVQVLQQSMNLLQLVLKIKPNSELKQSQVTLEVDRIMAQVVKKMTDSNMKIRNLSCELFKSMAGSQIFGVAICTSNLIRINDKQKMSSRHYISRLNSLSYLIAEYGINNNYVNSVLEFAVQQTENQNIDVRNSAISLLSEIGAAGADQKVKSSLEKLNVATKELVRKKMENIKRQKLQKK